MEWAAKVINSHLPKETRDKCLHKCGKYLDQFALSTKDSMLPRLDFV